MGDFLQKYPLDLFSFGLGFAAAVLALWILRLLRPVLARLNESFRQQTNASHQDALSIAEIRFRNETIQHAQNMHLAANLFSLDEILIPTRLLAPPLQPDTVQNTPLEDITEIAIPYTPDWPEMAAFYQAPTLGPLEALSNQANLVITGAAGCGKTVALAELANRLCAKTGDKGHLDGFAPLLVHAADLVIPPGEIENPLAIILDALSAHISQQTAASLPALAQGWLEQNRAILLLDGLDEFPQRAFDEIVQFLAKVQTAYPALRMVTVAGSEYFGRLPALGFAPLALAGWSGEQRSQFLTRWGALWKLHFSAPADGASLAADPALINSWLLQNSAFLNPFELVCKTWAAYTGDSLGPTIQHAIEATIRRFLQPHASQHRQSLEQLAANILLNQQPIPNRTTVRRWLGEQEEPAAEQTLAPDLEEFSQKDDQDIQKRPPTPDTLADLVTCGILRSHQQERFRIRHPAYTAHLAAPLLFEQKSVEKIISQPDWSQKYLCLGKLAAIDPQASWIQGLVKSHENDLLHAGLLHAARWLKSAPDKNLWTSSLMRRLAVELQNPQVPLALKSALGSALVLSGISGVAVLMRQLLKADDVRVRSLAALCSGMLADQKSTPELTNLLQDPQPLATYAAALALAAISSEPALDALAAGLLHGNGETRLAAAQSFANLPEQGYPTLQEASEHENPLVRRAVMLALARIHLPWVAEILETRRSLDTDWMVQDAIAQVQAASSQPNPHIPSELPELHQTPWLVAYAAQLGMGIAPGKPAEDLLIRALKEGDAEQKFAALFTLGRRCDAETVPAIYQVYFSAGQDMRQAALMTLKSLAAAGITLPPPIQYGYP